MSETLAAALIGAPVFRMRAELICRDLGSAAHRAVEKLQGMDIERAQIAAALGLRLDQIDALREELDGTHGQRVNTLRVWVDPAHGAVLCSDEGLDLIPAARYSRTPVLPLYPPAPEDLGTARFTRAASNRDPTPTHIVVDEIQTLSADISPASTQHARARGVREQEDHLLLLPETYVVISATEAGPQVDVYWGQSADVELTRVARRYLIDEGRLDPALLTPLAHAEASRALHGTLGSTAEEAYEVELAPGTVEDRLLNIVGLADEQLLLITDLPQRSWPKWLLEAHRDALGRGVECVVRERKGRAELGAGCGILAIRDGSRGIAHSSAHLLGAPWSPERLASQACLEVHAPTAVRRLLSELEVPAPKPRERPAERPLEDIAAEELRKALSKQRAELPAGTPVAILDEDMTAFIEQTERQYVNPHDQARMRQIAKGMAWERVLHAACLVLASEHPQLVIEDMRRSPPGGGIDLDIIMRDLEQRRWWILDAKNAQPDQRQLKQMERQLKIAREQEWIPEGFKAYGAIVYPGDIEPRRLIDYGEISRVRLVDLAALLTAEAPA